MSENVLRVQFLSIKDAQNQAFPNILLYIKKLTGTPVSCESTIKLEETDPTSSVILTFNETLDLPFDNEYFQILFIDAKSGCHILGDLVFWREHLINLVKNKDNQSTLVYTARLERNYVLEYTLQLIEDCDEQTKLNRKVTKHQLIQGHGMIVKQFKMPVYCTVCNKFIWGLHHQGYECYRCSLVAHPKCRQSIPFWCQKSSDPGSTFLIKDRRFGFDTPHVFKNCSGVRVRAKHCNHCGSHVLLNALKCERCHFIIHKDCESSVPPMCQIKYKKVAKILKTGDIEINKPKSCPVIPTAEAGTIKDDSDTSSVILTWLNSLPNEGLIPPPKFSDFEYIGCLGQGRYSSVYSVRHIPTDEYVAIKVIDGLIDQARHQFEVERQILYRYGDENPYMVKAYCSFHQGSTLFLVMDLVHGDTLNRKMQKRSLSEAEICFYLAEIISVLQYLHSKNIVYRDLKLEHIIINSEGHIRLIDYGLGRLLKTSDQRCHTVCGTDGYLAPELRRLEKKPSDSGYNYAVDYWALGMIFAEMLCGEQFGFHPENSYEANPSSMSFSRHTSLAARSCLYGLLEIDPEKRFGSVNSPLGSIRDHSFFKIGKINWQEIDEGLFKPVNKHLPVAALNSDRSVDYLLPNLWLDRTARVKADWISAGRSTCTENEENEFKLFDYVHRPIWSEFN